MSGTELYWSTAWADVVGADGPVVTDLLGRHIPCMTETERDELRRAWRDRYPVDSEVAPSLHRVWAVADGNALRAAVACAIQSCDRALHTHITGEVGSDDWHRWIDIQDALHAVVHALVLRRAEPAMVALAVPWETVMGALPDLDDLAEAAPGPDACWECKRPQGARLVTEAEATRYARTMQDIVRSCATAAYEREAAMKRRMRDWQGHYLPVATVRDAIEETLNWPGKIPSKVRGWVAEQLRMRLQLRLDLTDEPEQTRLFET